MSEVTIETLRTDVLGLHEKVTTELRAVEGERDGLRGQVAELEASRAASEAEAAAAKARVAQLEADAQRVPSGESGRLAEDLSGLSGGAKIAAGIALKRAGSGGVG